MKTDLSEEISVNHDSLGNLNIFIPESYIRNIEEKLLLNSVRRAVRISEKKHVSEYGDITEQLNRVYEAESSELDPELAKIQAASVWGDENW
ncbi:hypothetical protein QUF72_02845 [Desulfobacterales bacterium HSG2]|nr:hypothetical protein [Desulfobacterales bacterium HSG2]